MLSKMLLRSILFIRFTVFSSITNFKLIVLLRLISLTSEFHLFDKEPQDDASKGITCDLFKAVIEFRRGSFLIEHLY